MTSRERVLQRYPEAYVAKYPLVSENRFSIRAPYNLILGSGPTEESAWQDAARNLEKMS